MHPFGRNRYGSKIGRGLCPFGGWGAGSPSNTNVQTFGHSARTSQTDRTEQTDRQTDRQRPEPSDSIGRTVLQTVAQQLHYIINQFRYMMTADTGNIPLTAATKLTRSPSRYCVTFWRNKSYAQPYSTRGLTT